MESSENGNWLAVIGRAMALQCLSQADLRDKGFAEQGKFLECLGLSRRDAANLLGTNERSLSELLRQAKIKEGKKSGKGKKKN